MTRNFRRLWTLQTAFDTTIALVWYYTDTKWGRFCYHKYFHKKRDTKQTDICYPSDTNKRTFYYHRRIFMTDNEKKLLQAQHRLEEAQMRNRDKERKARTRRLIQEGAILEKVYPAAATMDLEKLEDFLYWALR